MDGESTQAAEVQQVFCLTPKTVDAFLRAKAEKGTAESSVAQYRNALNHLLSWLDGDWKLNVSRLQEWRRHLEILGYSKLTVQGYVSKINSFLRYYQCMDLCIPKPVRNDLTGRTFGYLTAIAPTEKRHHKYVVWKCVCRCGKEVEIPSGMLLEGNTTSCGCLNMEILQNRNRYEEGTELRRALEEKILNPDSVSGYVGVYPKRDKWAAHITYKKKTYYLGAYSNIEDAVKARARAKEAVMEDAARIYKETDHLYGDSPRRPPRPCKIRTVSTDSVIIRAKRSDNSSGFAGVTKKKGKWNASISVNKYRYTLGVFEELEDAVAIRKKAETLVQQGDLNTLKCISTNWK